MEIYAAAKREQSAPVKQQGTADRKSATGSSSSQSAKVEQFERTQAVISALEAQAKETEEKFRQAAARRLTDPEEGESSDEFKAMAERLKIMQRCQEIARRIMNGDRVPPEDEQYLLTNDPEGYKLAQAAKQPKRNPKEWESVLEDIEGAETTEADGAGEAGLEAVFTGRGGDRGGDGEGEAAGEADGDGG